MDEPVNFDVKERIATLTLNRPKVFNGLNKKVLQFLAERLVECSIDNHIAGVVITGEGKAFCAGGDLKYISTYSNNYGDAFHILGAQYNQAILEIRRMPKPVVAAINGLAAGGGFSMALACDFRIMETSAVLRQAYTTNGLSIDGGGTFTLPRLVGLARAMEIIAFDRPISAKTALSWGLVTEVVEDGKALKKALKLIKGQMERPISSFAMCKKLINDSFNTPFETQLEKERKALSWCADQPNGREGIDAFLKKRKPVYA